MNTEDRVMALRNVEFFRDIPETILRDLAERASLTTFTPDQVLMKEGEIGSRLFVLIEGNVGVYRMGLDGTDNVITYLSPPNVTGEMALLDESPRSASVKALERTEALVLEKQDFLDFIEHHPRTSFGIFRTLINRIKSGLDVINAMASEKDAPAEGPMRPAGISGQGSARVGEAARSRSEEESLGLFLVREELLDHAKMVLAMNRALDAGSPLTQMLIRMNLVDPAALARAEINWMRLKKTSDADTKQILQNLLRASYLDDARAAEYSQLAAEQILDRLHTEFALTDEDVLNLIDHGDESFRRIGAGELDPAVAGRISSGLIDEHRVIPLSLEANTLVLGMVSPSDTLVVHMVEAATGLDVKPRLILSANYAELRRALAELPGVSDAKSRESLEMLKDLSGLLRRSSAGAGSGGTIILVEGFLRAAVEARASDIHIEPMEDRTRIRFRVDGMLLDAISVPTEIHPRIVGAIKAAGEMDIANRLVPQDAKAVFETGKGERYTIRISTVPTVRGEKVVMRLHKESDVTLGIRDLGPTEAQFRLLTKLSRTPYGLVLVTGPVGSGKTTTLYSILHSIDVMKTNIVTIEDPIEYELPGVNHIEVNPKSGLTYIAGLKAILRQDPDVVMLGEIRDTETAQIATRAACTGVLMLSTLHTNDAPSALTALLHLGVEPFFIVNSLVGIVAQRLVRLVCEKCAETYAPTAETIRSLGLDPSREYRFRRGIGCSDCGHSGYRRRAGLFEILMITPALRDLILRGSPESEIRKMAVEEGMTTLRQSALSKVVEGKTTPEELMRKTVEDELGGSKN